MKPLSLKASLAILYTAMLTCLLSGLAYGYHRLLVRELETETDTTLEGLSSGLHGYLKFVGGQPGLDYNTTDPLAVTFIEEATRYYQLYDVSTGALLWQSAALESLGLQYTPAEVSVFASELGLHDVETDRGRLRIHSSLVEPGSGQFYLLQVGEPLDRFERAVRGSERLLLWEIAAGVLLAGLVGYWMAGRALRPLSHLAAAAHNVGITNLSERLPLRGSDDELDELATSFNQALARVEDGVAQMRQFSAAMAHELRTPLAVLRGETELALTQSASPAEVRQRLELQLEEFDRLSSLITQLLTLARAEAGEIPLKRAPVEMAALVTENGEQIEPVAEARAVRLVVSAGPSAIVMGDGMWLERLVLILLDNAIKFSKPGGHVSLTLSTSPDHVTLRVEDDGIGISPDALPHIFERFFQADPARSSHAEGAGLGLALAKWIVDHHGGTIQAQSTPGEGSLFTVGLPTRARAPVAA